jgi:hypothetical protein
MTILGLRVAVPSKNGDGLPFWCLTRKRKTLPPTLRFFALDLHWWGAGPAGPVRRFGEYLLRLLRGRLGVRHTTIHDRVYGPTILWCLLGYVDTRIDRNRREPTEGFHF